ncbi:MAG: hypothetical protein HXY45_22865 [Syntrophaceae bacterium]|nr:hypothetical protein [Syntrophaceae bacterium]
MKRLFLEFVMSLGFSIIGFWFVFYSWYYFLKQGIELYFFGDKTSGLSGILLGIPLGGILGILLAQKLVYKTKGWNVFGTAMALILSIIGCLFGIYMMDEVGSYVIFLIPLLVAMMCLIGYHFKVLFR